MSVKLNTKINVAVVGCGNWGKNLIRVFHQLGVLVGICDIDHNKMAEFHQKYGIPKLSLTQILNSKDIQAMIIATPSVTHFELGMLALQANKHVFIEKPLALHTAHAHDLHQLAQKQQRILMVGHLLHYHSGFHALKKLNQEGAFGTLQYIYCTRLNFGKFKSEESVLWDYAPHDISMILSLTGMQANQVYATYGNHLQHTSVDSVFMHLNFDNNIKAHIFCSWLHPYKEQKLILVGSKGMAIFDDCQPMESKLKRCHYPSEWVDGLPRPFPFSGENVALELSEPLLNECQHFLDCIRHHRQPQTGGIEGISVMTVLDCATQSMATRLPVSIRKQTQTQLTDKILGIVS